MSFPDYFNMPAGKPPPGVTPNFDHPQSRAIAAHIGMGICIGITSVLIILRVYVKLAITKFWGWDDWTCLMAYVLITAHDIVAFTIMGPGKWIGIHIWDIRAMSFTKGFFQCTLVGTVLYIGAALSIKLSLFIFYLRLFKPNKIVRWLIYGGITACGVFYSVSIIVTLSIMIPSPNQPDTTASWALRAWRSANHQENILLSLGSFGIISDIYLLVIPIRSVYQLQLPTKRKLGILAIFMVGFIAVACTAGTTITRAQQDRTNDGTWVHLSTLIWNGAEISGGIICSCSPVIAALFRPRDSKKVSKKPPSFAPLRLITQRFTSRSSRRLIGSGSDHPFETLPPPRGDNRFGEVDSSMQLNDGTSVAKSMSSDMV